VANTPSSSDGVNVRLGADTGSATSSFNDAASQIASSLKGIQDALQSFGANNKKVLDDAVKNNANLSRSFLELKGSVTGGFNAIAGVVERFRGVLGTLTAALGGGALWHEAISDSNEFTASVTRLSKTMGITSAEASVLAVALHRIGSDPDSYIGAFTRFERQIRANGPALEALGVDLASLRDGTKTTDEVFQESIGILEQYKEGHDRLQVAMVLFGTRGVAEVDALLRLHQKGLQEAREETERLGLTVTEQGIAMKQAYTESLAGVHMVWEGMAKAITDIVMPSLTAFANQIRSVGPTVVQMTREVAAAFSVGMGAVRDVVKALWQTITSVFASIGSAIDAVFGTSSTSLAAMEFFRNVLKVVEIAIVGFKTGVLLALDLIRQGFEQLAATMTFLKTATQRALVLDFSGAKAAWTEYMAEIRRLAEQHVADMFRIAKEGRDAIASIATAPPTAAPTGTARKPQGGKTAPDFGSQGSDDRLAAWKDELLQMQEAEGYFHEFSKAQEAEFWQAKLALVRGNGQADVQLRRELNRLIFEDNKAAANEELQTDLATMQRMIDAAKNSKDQQISIAVARTALMKATFGEESKEYQHALDEETKLRQEWVAKEQAMAKDLASFRRDMAKIEVQGDQQALDQAVALRQISAQQKFAIEQQLENKLYALDLQALEEQRATLQQGTLAYQQNAEAIEKLEVQHQQKLTQIANQAELDRKQYALQAIQDTENAFSTFFSSIATGTNSLKTAFQNLAKSIEDSLAKIASDQIAKQLFGAGTAGGNFLNNIFGKIFGTGASSNATGAAALTSAGTTLTTAGTTLTSSGSLLSSAAAALQAAAATFSAGGLGGSFGGGNLFGGLSSGFGNAIDMSNFLPGGIPFFAAGTNYVPRDTLAFIHKGEAVVPASINKSARYTQPSGGMQVHNHFIVQGAIDQRAQGQIAAASARGLAIAQRRHT